MDTRLTTTDLFSLGIEALMGGGTIPRAAAIGRNGITVYPYGLPDASNLDRRREWFSELRAMCER